jgi:RpiB/LacA/LacB family sugar-phosphate isomerase
MRIVVGADHAGYAMKRAMAERLSAAGHTLVDVGTHDADTPVDYPDFAVAVGSEVLAGRAERGVLLCGSGVGASVAANKLAGIRAGLCHDAYSAHQGVEHDDMNVLVLGARVVGVEAAWEFVRAFVGATYSAEARHARRLDKVRALETRR